MMRAFTLLLVGVLLLPAHAIDPGEALTDPALEARARALSVEFRALSARTSRLMTAMRRWRATFALWCVRAFWPVIATKIFAPP